MTLAEQYLKDITGTGEVHLQTVMLAYYRKHKLITHVSGFDMHSLKIVFIDDSYITTPFKTIQVHMPVSPVDFSVLCQRMKDYGWKK